MRVVGRLADALKELRRCKADYVRLGANGRNQYQVRMNIAGCLLDGKRYEEASLELAEAEAFTPAFGSGPSFASYMLAYLRTDVAVRSGDVNAGERHFAKAEELCAAVFGDADPYRADRLRQSGMIHEARGRLDEAIAAARKELELRRESLGPSSPISLDALGLLMQYLVADGKDDEALPLARELVQLTDADAPQLAQRQGYLERMEARLLR